MTKTNSRKRVKLGMPIRSLKAGESIEGIYRGIETLLDENGKPVEKEGLDGKMRVLEFAKFQESADDEQSTFGIWNTGGLQGALKLARVKPGMMIEVVSKGKVEFGDGGQTVNDYEIFGLEA